MTLTPPAVQAVEIPSNLLTYRPVSDIAPFTYRSGMTYQALLEGLRVYVTTTLTHYLSDNFEGFEEAWENNLNTLLDAVNTALATQRDEVAADLAETLAEIVSGANAALNDATVLGALQSAASKSLAYLDKRYVGFGNLGVLFPESFAAKGDGAADDREAVQAAIDAANALYKTTGRQITVFMSNTYALGGVDYYLDNGQPQGACCILLKSGVILAGTGTLMPRAGAYGPGAYFRTVCSPSTGLIDAGIRDLTFTGNLSKFADSTGAGNIDLFVDRNFTVQNTRHLDANGCDIRIVGNKAKNVKVLHNTIVGGHNVGIQASGFDGLIIADNYVVNTRDNGIDIYGEMGSGVDSNGINFDIHDNYIANCPTGICPETVAMGRVHNNVIVNCPNVGIQMNRINSLPHTVDIVDNTILFCGRGVAVVGGMQDIRVARNTVRGSSIACIQLGWGGDCAGVMCEDNTLNGADGTVPRVLITGATASDITVRNNRSRFSDGYTDVVNNANNSVRVFTQSNNFPKNGKVEVASGQSFQVYLPPNTAGRIVMQASSGGGFQSVWEGIWTSSASVAYLKEVNRQFIDSAHDLFGAVQVLGGTMNMGVQFPQTGSTIAARWMLEYL